jgi:mannose/fructose/N-acetylgalactosamine-specific phosphotransferase system component IIC
MFAGLINNAKSAASGLLLKYIARASVAVPFVIAIGFALAACTVMLVERFGQVMAYWLVAGGLAVIGAVAAAVVSVREEQEEAAEKSAEASDTSEIMSDAAVQAMVQAPIAVLGTLLSVPGGASAALGTARLLGRNWALVVLMSLIALLYWPDQRDAGNAPQPNGRDTVHEPL